MSVVIQTFAGAPPRDAGEITAGLVAFNVEATGLARPEAVTVMARDEESGAVVAGLRGKISAGWLHVGELWVAQELRGDGIGSAILAEAEQEAMRRRCLGAHLDTFSFQAPGFYERQGYEVFGAVEDHPPGHRRLFLQKRFVYPPAD